MDPLDLQSLMLLDLNVQRRLRCDGGLSRLGGLFLQIYVTTRGQESNANQNKKNKGHVSAKLTLGLALPV